MKKLIFSTMICAMGLFGFHNPVHAQSMGHTYETGLGLKFNYGFAGAITVKHFLKPTRAIEGLLGFGPDWFKLTGLYEFHGDIKGAPGLKWYAGPGAHVGMWSTGYESASGVFVGIDGVVGLDYKINKAPIDLSLDIQPAISIPDAFLSFWGGLSVRYTF